AGFAAGAFRDAGQAALPEKRRGSLHVAVGVDEGTLAVHYASAGLFAQRFYVVGGNLHPLLLSSVIWVELLGGRWNRGSRGFFLGWLVFVLGQERSLGHGGPLGGGRGELLRFLAALFVVFVRFDEGRLAE